VTTRRGDAMIRCEQASERRHRMLGRDWESAQATIVTRRVVAQGHGGEGGHLSWVEYEYIADVTPDGPAPPFRASFGEPRNGIHFRAPEVGQVVHVKFLARSQRVKFDRSDMGIHRDLGHRKEDQAAVAAAHTQEAQAQFDAEANAAPGTSILRETGSPAGGSPTASDDQSVLAEISAAIADITATTAQMSAETSNTAETISAIKRARAAGDLAEVDRLKAASNRLLANARESRDQAAPAADPLERLATLADLHDRGALTDSEFATEKAKILGGD
jgi:hypothetical protein